MSQFVGWAEHSASAPDQNVRVDHCGPDIAVTQELLHGSDVIPVFQQMGGKRAAQRVGGGLLVQTDLAGGLLYGPLDDRFIQMMPALAAGTRINRKTG